MKSSLVQRRWPAVAPDILFRAAVELCSVPGTAALPPMFPTGALIDVATPMRRAIAADDHLAAARRAVVGRRIDARAQP